VLATLARVLGLDLAALTQQVAHFPRNDFLPVITLRQSAYNRLKPIIYPLIGVHFQSSELPLGPTPGYGQAVLGQVGPATAQALSNAGPLALGSDVIGLSGLQFVYQRRLAGIPSGQIDLLNSAGHVVAKLRSFRGHAGSAVKTTLSVPLQTAAERALPQNEKPSALIAVQASTGQILAIANRPRSDYDLALDGADPPGSTFKVITTSTLLAHGFNPATPVPCPPSITVDGKVFTNFQGESAEGASFEQDFAQSCNAAFISLYGRLGPSDLSTEAVQQFGFGTHWQLPLAYYSGQAPPAADTVEQAADMIGQGRILASPLNMALVAASVDSGAWHPPTLVTAPAMPAAAPGSSDAPPAPRPLPTSIVTELQTLMRAVVTSGTGTAANLPGVPVYGKTGTAEFGTANPPRTDAWFIGYRGDLAFAVVVQGGGVGGQVAAPIAARFLQNAAGVSVP
jgi:cell division protein FtsI/penicillin-binding protein 2